MSYLAGPLTRDQIRGLAQAAGPAAESTAVPPVPAAPPRATTVAALSPEVPQFYLPGKGAALDYFPRLLGAADVLYESARYRVHERRSAAFLVGFADGPVEIDWDHCERIELDVADLRESADKGARYADCPAAAGDVKAYAGWQKAFAHWLRRNEVLTLYRSKRFGLTSAVGETEGDFRIRVQVAAREQRGLEIDKLRKRYAGKARTLDGRLLRTRQALEREQEQSSKKKLDVVVSSSNAILGALLGRKKVSSATAGRIGTAIRTAGGAGKESADVERAAQTVAKAEAELESLNDELEREIAALDTAVDAQSLELEEIVVRAKATDIAVSVFGLAWLPYAQDADGRLKPAW